MPERGPARGPLLRLAYGRSYPSKSECLSAMYVIYLDSRESNHAWRCGMIWHGVDTGQPGGMGGRHTAAVAGRSRAGRVCMLGKICQWLGGNTPSARMPV